MAEAWCGRAWQLTPSHVGAPNLAGGSRIECRLLVLHFSCLGGRQPCGQPQYSFWSCGQTSVKKFNHFHDATIQQRLKDPIDYPIGTPVGSCKVTQPLLDTQSQFCLFEGNLMSPTHSRTPLDSVEPCILEVAVNGIGFLLQLIWLSRLSAAPHAWWDELH